MCYFGVEELSRPSIMESLVDWIRGQGTVLMMAHAIALHPKTLFHTKNPESAGKDQVATTTYRCYFAIFVLLALKVEQQKGLLVTLFMYI